MWLLEKLDFHMWIIIIFLLNNAALELDCMKFHPDCVILEKLLNLSAPLFLPLKHGYSQYLRQSYCEG